MAVERERERERGEGDNCWLFSAQLAAFRTDFVCGTYAAITSSEKYKYAV